MYKDKAFWIGVLAGMVTPPIAFWVYYYIRFHNFNQVSALEVFYKAGLSSAVLSLSVIANLAVFYAFLWAKKDMQSRGVVMATILYAIIGFGLKLLT